MTSVLMLLLALVGAPPAASTTWPQWGGPDRNFITQTTGLATSWPADGPRRLWQRTLGDGFSAIVSDGATLYTLFRDGDDDVAIAIEASSGRTVWESRYAAPFNETCSERLGAAPRAAPLIAGDRVITVSSGGLMHSFDRRTGRAVWSRELLEGAADAVRACGYATSPLAFEDMILTFAGGQGRGVIALNASSGAPVWQSQDFENGYSSPILIDLDGRPELIAFTYAQISGLDPRTGALEWSHPHAADMGVNVATPIWGADHLLFISSAYNGGSRVLKLSRQASGVHVEEVWANRRVRIHFGNAVRFGQRIYASNGDFGAAPFAAIDVTSGEIIWRDRSVARSTLIGADGKLIILDEDGNLVLATPGDTGLTVLAKASVLTNRAWTAPTLCGSVLYLRDRKQIVALDLGS